MSKDNTEKDLGSAVTCWMPKSLLAWVDTQRKDGETRSGTIKRILRTSWAFSESFRCTEAMPEVNPMPQD